MTHSFDHMLVKAYHGKTLKEILKAPPNALWGISKADARHLEDSLGIKTIADMGGNRFFQRALAVLAASEMVNFDTGPSIDWANFFKSAPIDFYENHPSGRFRLDFGPVFYRGRLDGSARILVVGQDPSTNEILSHRIFVGKSGQRVQGFLRKLGVTRSYIMVNTFLYSVFGQFDTELRRISLEDPILTFRNTLLDKLVQENSIQAVLTVGNGARHAIENWTKGESLIVVNITHPASPDETVLLSSWNSALLELKGLVDPDNDVEPDQRPYGDIFVPDDEVSIPQFDLPFGVPDWHGKGTHSQRDGNKTIIWTAP
jgi:hypothetical protein